MAGVDIKVWFCAGEWDGIGIVLARNAGLGPVMGAERDGVAIGVGIEMGSALWAPDWTLGGTGVDRRDAASDWMTGGRAEFRVGILIGEAFV